MTTGGNYLRGIPARLYDGARRTRPRIMAYFLTMHAVSAADAVPYLPQDAAARRELARMIAAGVVLRDDRGRYHVDRAKEWQARDRFRRHALPWVITLSVLAAFALTRFYTDDMMTLR